MGIFAIVPGLPTAPFLILAIFAGLAGMVTGKGLVKDETEEEVVEEEEVKPEEKIEDYLNVDQMEMEIGYGLIPLVDISQGGDLLERITMIRRQCATEMGIIVPPIRIRG